MRFKSQQPNSQIPTIDLIPMLNVMMAVLAFFVLVSMTLTSEPEGVEVRLPSSDEVEVKPTSDLQDSLIVTLKPDGQILLGEVAIGDRGQLWVEIQTYLQQSDRGSVLLVADPDANYEQVIQLLAQMRQVGGDRVSLGIESE